MFLAPIASVLSISGCGEIRAAPIVAAPSPDASDSGLGQVCGAPQNGFVCRNDLSNIGTADFRITMRVTTTSSQLSAVVNQRAYCTNGMFWDIRVSADPRGSQDSGQIFVEVDDHVAVSDPAAHYTGLSSTVRVDDGHAHCLMISRKAKTITIFIDGIEAGSASSMSSLGQLPPLVTGTDPCGGYGCIDVPNFGRACGSGTSPFVGTISDLCLESP